MSYTGDGDDKTIEAKLLGGISYWTLYIILGLIMLIMLNRSKSLLYIYLYVIVLVNGRDNNIILFQIIYGIRAKVFLGFDLRLVREKTFLTLSSSSCWDCEFLLDMFCLSRIGVVFWV